MNWLIYLGISIIAAAYYLAETLITDGVKLKRWEAIAMFAILLLLWPIRLVGDLAESLEEMIGGWRGL